MRCEVLGETKDKRLSVKWQYCEITRSVQGHSVEVENVTAWESQYAS